MRIHCAPQAEGGAVVSYLSGLLKLVIFSHDMKREVPSTLFPSGLRLGLTALQELSLKIFS